MGEEEKNVCHLSSTECTQTICTCLHGHTLSFTCFWCVYKFLFISHDHIYSYLYLFLKPLPWPVVIPRQSSLSMVLHTLSQNLLVLLLASLLCISFLQTSFFGFLFNLPFLLAYYQSRMACFVYCWFWSCSSLQRHHFHWVCLFCPLRCLYIYCLVFSSVNSLRLCLPSSMTSKLKSLSLFSHSLTWLVSLKS